MEVDGAPFALLIEVSLGEASGSAIDEVRIQILLVERVDAGSKVLLNVAETKLFANDTGIFKFNQRFVIRLSRGRPG